MAHVPALADTQAVLLECSATATDERSVDECLALVFEEAEAALTGAELRWQQLLEATPLSDAPVVQADIQSSDASQAQALKSSENSESNVIAIVNDTALQEGLSIDSATVINVDEGRISTDTPTLADNELPADVDNAARFSFLPALFRSFRDQHCAWEATLFGAERTDAHYNACLTDLSRARTNSLNQALIEQRIIAKSGRGFAGYYVGTGEGAAFQACDRKIDWWVTGNDALLASLERRYTDANNSTGPNLFYAEFRGELQAAPVSGVGSDYSASLLVQEINVLRPVAPNDCEATKPLSVDNVSEAEIASSAATVDDYASAGFLYGYFNHWVSACSVTENSVCSTETDARFASDGDWKIRVDRSLENDWRVQLIPTTNDQVIDKALVVQIDDGDVFIDNSLQAPLIIPLRRGADIATGELARQLIAKMRSGTELRFAWRNQTDIVSELKFSLDGVTRALEFFDSSEP